ncbi:TM2 domain-containing protein [Flavobacteriaceae bacterium S356]|uniref:TM2 domain-containing protein n=1 Tax=Asprobacillus argus TaxID=3076534 RepID=A0ABU3LCD4_9FLAO|nr:TM2 domain-containing protein [Flavobacteriaceae bacterium S356]
MDVVDDHGNKIPEQESKRVIAGILAIFLGWAGVHKFVLGYTNEGLAMLILTIVLSIVTCGIFSGFIGLIGLIEGIIYLTKTDEEFVYEYQVNKKPWF